VERVKPRLQHANSAVVLSATKVIIRFLDVLTDSDKVNMLAFSRTMVQDVSKSYGQQCVVP
jgi:hypothetical protein